MLPRRIIGILARRLLGAAMRVVLFGVERRLTRRSVQAARDAPRETDWGTETSLATTARTIHKEPGGERAAYSADQRGDPTRRPRGIGGHGRSDEGAAEPEGEG